MMRKMGALEDNSKGMKEIKQEIGKKRCSVCKRLLPISEEYFHREKRTREGFRSMCKECNRNRHLQEKYGISIEHYNLLLKAQNNKCLICGIENLTFKNNFVVDHNHETDEIRGLLCNKCNAHLHLLENPDKRLRFEKYQLRSLYSSEYLKELNKINAERSS